MSQVDLPLNSKVKRHNRRKGLEQEGRGVETEEDRLKRFENYESRGEIRGALKTVDEKLKELEKRKEVVQYYGQLKMPQTSKAGKQRDLETYDEYGAFTDFDGGQEGRRVSTTGVPRFDRYLNDKKAKLSKLKKEQEMKEESEMKQVPTITKYDLPNDRVPVHKRDLAKKSESRRQLHEDGERKKRMREYEECTFSPDINRPRSKSKDFDRDEITGKSANELMDWKKERDSRVALLRLGTLREDDRQCTFRPELNGKSKKIMSRYENGGMPLKQSKKEFVEEFIKKEKEDLFKPKINMNSYDIVEKGYNAPVPKETPRKLKPKSEKKPKSASKAKAAPTIHKNVTPRVGMTEELIKERYRTQAHPQLMHRHPSSISKSIKQLALSSRGLRPDSPSRAIRNYGISPRGGGNLSRKFGFENVRNVGDQTGKQGNLYKDTIQQGSSVSVRKVMNSEIEKILRDANRIRRGGRSRSRGSQRSVSPREKGKSRSPSKNKFFDDQYWMDLAKEQNDIRHKKRIDELIYKDEHAHPSARSLRKYDSLHHVK